jgi:hypothetical protein
MRAILARLHAGEQYDKPNPEGAGGWIILLFAPVEAYLGDAAVEEHQPFERVTRGLGGEPRGLYRYWNRIAPDSRGSCGCLPGGAAHRFRRKDRTAVISDDLVWNHGGNATASIGPPVVACFGGTVYDGGRFPGVADDVYLRLRDGSLHFSAMDTGRRVSWARWGLLMRSTTVASRSPCSGTVTSPPFRLL